MEQKNCRPHSCKEISSKDASVCSGIFMMITLMR
jgi:hypothetical protein